MIHLKLKVVSGKLPTSDYRLFDDNNEIGIIQIRHKPSFGVGVPENMASHIYYEIFPAHQRKGYGKKILSLGLEKVKEVGLKEVLLSVVEDNIGSIKIIKANGGIFIEEATLPNGKKILKYKILI